MKLVSKKKIGLLSFVIVLGIIIGFVLYEQNSKTKRISVQTYGAKEDDNKDDTEAILAAIKDIGGRENVELYFSKGTYLISAPIEIDKSIDITGKDAILKLSSNYKLNEIGQGFFYSESVDDINLKGLTFDGNKNELLVDPMNNFVTWFNNSSNITIVDCHAININGKGKNLNTAFGFIGNSNSITVKNTIVEDSNGGAVFFQGSDSVAEDNIAINVGDVAYVANGSHSKNVVFKENVIAGASTGSIAIENGSTDILIQDNRIYNLTDGYGIGIVSVKDRNNLIPKNIRIKGNIIDSNLGANPSNGIAVELGENIAVEDNIVRNLSKNNQSNSSIWIGEQVKNSVVRNNHIRGTEIPSITSQSKQNVIIDQNEVTN